ncbi:MAG: preprotein translocase subunit SecG [Clostridiales bacterium]|jgi:preprotein translocase subunit SecG|nr:preprotein translocase subunit SecG [Clostridiales bacterium]
MLETIVTIIYVLICLAIVVLVLMQEGKSGLSSSIGGGSANSYWGKNKDRSIEGSVPKLTGIFAGIYIVLSIVLNMI